MTLPVHRLVDYLKSTGLIKFDTFIVESQSGGFHIYFKNPNHLKFGARPPGFEAIDVKQVGGYVVAAGSTYNKRTYNIVRHDPCNVAELPQEIINTLKVKHDDNGNGNGNQFHTYDDSKPTCARFTQYLMQPAMKDASSFKAACEGKAYGLSPEMVCTLMMDS